MQVPSPRRVVGLLKAEEYRLQAVPNQKGPTEIIVEAEKRFHGGLELPKPKMKRGEDKAITRDHRNRE